MWTRFGLVLSLACLFAASAGADAVQIDAPFTGPSPRIVNGLPTVEFPSVGSLLDGGNPLTARAWCTGTLIGCETFLTAAHCVEDDLNPASYTVYFQHAGLFSVTSIAVPGTYSFPVDDIAVLKLGPSVTGIPPAPIDTAGGHAIGAPGTIVGFGRTDGSVFDYGLKRSGEVAVAPCGFGISDVTSICWDFDNPLGPPGDDSNTCNADSGGPLFIDAGSGDLVAGVTSGGNSNDCRPFDNSFDTRVSNYVGFIQTEAGPDLNSVSCGDAMVGDPDVDVYAFDGTLNGASPQALHSFAVEPGIPTLRVTANGHDDGFSDFDLYVRAGAPPTTSTFDCASTGPNQYGFCEFAFPVSGTWYVLIDRFAGAGDYQVTATALGTFCSELGNDGLACDDGNDCTLGELCQLGVCAGAAVANGVPCDDGNSCTPTDTCQGGVCAGESGCGDGVVQASCEQCDDGGTGDGDGCDSSCTVERCYQCGGEPSACGPPTSCSSSGKSVLMVKDDADPSKDSLVWKWINGTTDVSAFGTPMASTPYSFCLRDDGELIVSASVGAGGTCGTKDCWKTLGRSGSPSGYKYKNADTNGEGVLQLLLKEGVGSAKLLWKSQGPNLILPGPAGGRYFNQSSEVSVHVVREDDGTCWESTFSAAKRNAATRFKAKAQ